jgi:ribosome-binding protein aMBF1 (putative translation factor)
MNELTFDDVLEKIKAEGQKERETVEAAVMVSEIIEKLVDARINKGISQRELAQISGIRQPAIARMEKVKAIPRLDTLARIAVCLGVEIKAEQVTIAPYSYPEKPIAENANNYSTHSGWTGVGYTPRIVAMQA